MNRLPYNKTFKNTNYFNKNNLHTRNYNHLPYSFNVSTNNLNCCSKINPFKKSIFSSYNKNDTIQNFLSFNELKAKGDELKININNKEIKPDNFFIDDSKKNKIICPNLAIIENSYEYKMLIEVPGIKENQIKIDLYNHKLKIHGEKEQKISGFDLKYNNEVIYGYFERYVDVPNDVVEKFIEAELKDGVLEIILPKNNPEELSKIVKHINIKKY